MYKYIINKDGIIKKDNFKFKLNNPNNEPVGHFTGRCSKCGSKNLWDDNLAYGCNDCGAILLSQNS